MSALCNGSGCLKPDQNHPLSASDAPPSLKTFIRARTSNRADAVVRFQKKDPASLNNFNCPSRRPHSVCEVDRTRKRNVTIHCNATIPPTPPHFHQNKRTHPKTVCRNSHRRGAQCTCVSVWMRERVWRNFTFRFGNVAPPFVDIWEGCTLVSEADIFVFNVGGDSCFNVKLELPVCKMFCYWFLRFLHALMRKLKYLKNDKQLQALAMWNSKGLLYWIPGALLQVSHQYYLLKYHKGKKETANPHLRGVESIIP